jgi:hypothetical protein
MLPSKRARRAILYGLGLAAILVIIYLLTVLTTRTRPAEKTAGPPLPPVPRITALSKVVGLQDQITGALPANNDGSFGVFGADLGAITLYGNHWYMALGDTAYAPIAPGLQGNFLVGASPYQSGQITGLPLDSYLALKKFVSA